MQQAPSRAGVGAAPSRKASGAIGAGRHAGFTITEAGRQRVHIERPPDFWHRVWDERWRVFTYDLPARRKKNA